MKKESRSAWPAITTVILIVLVGLGTGGFSVYAEGVSPQLFVLAHTPMTTVEGSTTVIPNNRGPYDFLQYNPTKIGDAITFSLSVQKAGKYRLQATTYKDGAEGIYRLEINGRKISKKDFYESNTWEIGTFDVKPGTHQVTFRCVGKNPKSSGIGVKLGNLHFR